MDAQRKSLNDRFTDFSDRMTEDLGNWYWPVVGLILCTVWAGFGPYTHYSDSWQLWINTPTTIAEFFFELFILASNNRQVRNDHKLQSEILRQQEQITAMLRILGQRAEAIKTEEDVILKDVETGLGHA